MECLTPNDACDMRCDDGQCDAMIPTSARHQCATKRIAELEEKLHRSESDVTMKTKEYVAMMQRAEAAEAELARYRKVAEEQIRSLQSS